MEFRNLTAFPALAFEGIDQRSQPFHTVVLRQTLDLTSNGPIFADEQAPLCAEDAYFGDVGRSGVRQESDLCHFKPKCDVIVNGSTHAPRGEPAQRFAVRLRMYQPGGPAPMPPPPQGLNPLMSAAPEAMRAWRETCARLRGQEHPRDMLIDKTLVVTGPRKFCQRAPFARVLARICTWLTLGLLRPERWWLTPPQPCRSVPLTPERAFGGECRIFRDDPAAERVPKRYRLDADGGTGALVASTVFAANPFGVGWVEGWFLQATGTTCVPAPQIEYPDRHVDIDLFRRIVAGEVSAITRRDSAGFGVRPKTHPERARRTGTADEAFATGDRWLPDDFDFAIWNAAPPDQQIAFPTGGEIVELTNVCLPDAPGAVVDASGNTVLRFALRRDLPFVLARFEDGSIGELPTRLDTVLVDTDRQQLSCVWRATLPKRPSVRVLEARMINASEIAALKAQYEAAAQPAAEAQHG